MRPERTAQLIAVPATAPHRAANRGAELPTRRHGKEEVDHLRVKDDRLGSLRNSGAVSVARLVNISAVRDGCRERRDRLRRDPESLRARELAGLCRWRPPSVHRAFERASASRSETACSRLSLANLALGSWSGSRTGARTRCDRTRHVTDVSGAEAGRADHTRWPRPPAEYAQGVRWRAGAALMLIR